MIQGFLFKCIRSGSYSRWSGFYAALRGEPGGFCVPQIKKPQHFAEALYPERDLNPHAQKGHRILSPACLPIPPSGRVPGVLSPDSYRGPLSGQIIRRTGGLYKRPVNGPFVVWRARNGIRTRDPNLGKVVLYQLSYSRL